MVFGDNVRARRAARALPRTPTQRGRERRRGKQATRPHHLRRYSTTHNTTRQDKTCTVITHRHHTHTTEMHTTTRDNTTHTPPSRSPHTPQHSNTKKKRTARHEGTQCKGNRTQCKVPDLIRRQGTLRREQGQHKARGQHNSTPLPPFNRTTTQTEGGHHAQDREASNTAALPPPCHPTIHNGTPPSTMAPPTTNVRGEWTEDTPPHEHHRHTLTTHTPHTRQRTLCDMTAVLASTATE